MHSTHIGRARLAGRTFGRRRVAATRHHGRWERPIRFARSGGHHGRRVAWVRRGQAVQQDQAVGQNGLLGQLFGQDRAIRQQVGPASAYRTVSTTGATQVGGASYYSGRNHTASGGYVGAATCAHRSLPFGTRVLVTNLSNARQAVLTVNDRGPFVRGRIVDVSRGAAGTLGMLGAGVARVSLRVVGGPG